MSLSRGKRRQDLQEMLTQVGLNAEYWIPKFQKHVGVTCAMDLKYIKPQDFQKLKCKAQSQSVERALEKLLELSESSSHPDLQISPVERIQKGQTHMEQTMKNLKDLQSQRNHRQDEAVSRRETVQKNQVKKQLKSLKHKKNEPYKTQKVVIENGPFQDLLQRLGLERYYPKRMSRAHFHLIHKTSMYNTQPASEQELPKSFLQKLLVLDSSVRHLVFKEGGNIENQVCKDSSYWENEVLDPYEDMFKDSDDITIPATTTSRPHIHPMDIQMAILHCADNFARQYILGKLSICQFALPLLVPTPNTSQMEFSLWSLRQIRRSWQEASASPQRQSNCRNNQQMCRVSSPIVSFIRVGHGLSASKSQIMNSLLSKRKHDVFFHRHCRGSSKDCLLMDGVVELCWFCPDGEEDRFQQCVTFTNLHGDAKEHKRQLTFLQEVSSLIVILMSASDDNKDNQRVVRDLWQASRPLICLLDDKERTMAKNSGQRVTIGIRNRNEAELTEELTAAIKHLLEQSDTALSLEECSLIAHRQGFLVDEHQTDCQEAKEKAQTIMALLAGWELSEVKENLLPLQGQLWHLWCKKDKELYHLSEKGNRSIEQHKSEIETEKRKIRSKQLDKAFPLNDLMRSVLEILQEDSETHPKLYLLQWLSVFLDKLTTGHLEKLHEEQRSLFSKVQKEKQKAQDSNYLNNFKTKIEAISIEICNCTLGIEHLLREVGQIYEALEEMSREEDPLFLSLPEIAADLMVSGVPIELMDGDAPYVPLKWVAAVFDKVSEKLGDKRLFVLSVLGLQSSGKSTLLNALFGLQFTVSAGRCTRGAYMQLLKVEETLTEDLGFDFVLVVDTEGLRAPELNQKSQNWDNELATFVFGLGNLTLVNIFGENPSEMQDILQIVVQAFLRMKQVKISPSCLFVHQNVGEATAKDQTMEGRRRLLQKLDQMTALAAEQEECPNVTRFSDVIKFDCNTHVYYFAHLWDGNPPMAPPNHRYSHNVQELKSRILFMAQQEARRSIMKISDVKLRVKDLWQALVSENFIFNFRNTQEVMAMNKLETMYNQWSWELRSHMLDLQNQLNNQIYNGKVQTLTAIMMEAPVNKKYEAVKQEFEKFFKEDQDSEILVQWKANFEHKLLILKETLISDTRWKMNELLSLTKGQERLDKQKTLYEKELLERSRELALRVKSKELGDTELYVIFNQFWTEWVCHVFSSVPNVIEPQIDLDSENILLDYFKKEKNIAEKVSRYSGEPFEFNFDRHVQVKKTHSWFSMTSEVHHKESSKMITNQIMAKFNETINKINKQQRDYSKNDFLEILRIIETEVKYLPLEEGYTFTSNYRIELLLCLFRRASKSFKEMHRKFKRANDPVSYLESKKGDFFTSFKISCQGATSVTSFVDFLWKKLISAISATLMGKMAPKLAGDLRATCPAFNGNRANLEKHILISLAEEESFDDYWQCIHHPKSSSRTCFQNYIRRYISHNGSEKVKTVLKMSLDGIRNAILTAIYESTAVAEINLDGTRSAIHSSILHSTSATKMSLDDTKNSILSAIHECTSVAKVSLDGVRNAILSVIQGSTAEAKMTLDDTRNAILSAIHESTSATKICLDETKNAILSAIHESTSLAKASLDDIRNAILSAMHESTAVAEDEGTSASLWLDSFCDHLGDILIFPRRDLISIEHQEIRDMKFLKEAMSAALDPAMEKVEENCSSMPIDEMIPEIEKILSEHLCGCWKQCPFCNTICTNTIPNHEGDHSVPLHCPKAVSRWQ